MHKEENIFWFPYYRKIIGCIDITEIQEKGWWRPIPEVRGPFLSKQDALDMMEWLAGEKLERVKQSYYDLKYHPDLEEWYFPSHWYHHYAVHAYAVMYDDLNACDDNPWYLGALREIGGVPRPIGIYNYAASAIFSTATSGLCEIKVKTYG